MQSIRGGSTLTNGLEDSVISHDLVVELSQFFLFAGVRLYPDYICEWHI
jgi:hypothetical protein